MGVGNVQLAHAFGRDTPDGGQVFPVAGLLVKLGETFRDPAVDKIGTVGNDQGLEKGIPLGKQKIGAILGGVQGPHITGQDIVFHETGKEGISDSFRAFRRAKLVFAAENT